MMLTNKVQWLSSIAAEHNTHTLHYFNVVYNWPKETVDKQHKQWP